MTDLAALITNGHAVEDEVADRLAALGWEVDLFGSRAAENTLRILSALARTRYPIRHAPDLIVARDDRLCLVEVIRCDPEAHEHRSIELAKLEALNVWSLIAPVAVVDAGDWLAWLHRAGWATECVSDVSTRTRVGTGDPFAWFNRVGTPFASMFGATS
jgi:hypothetical protein